MVTINNWFETKIKYLKIDTQDGKEKMATNVYLIDALNFSDAENRATEEVKPFMTGEFSVSAVKRSKIYEIFESKTGEKWYKVKVLFVIIDQEKGTEKKIPSIMMVQADNIREALDRLDIGMNGTMSDYEVSMISETHILDIFPYKE